MHPHSIWMEKVFPLFYFYLKVNETGNGGKVERRMYRKEVTQIER